MYTPTRQSKSAETSEESPLIDLNTPVVQKSATPTSAIDYAMSIVGVQLAREFKALAREILEKSGRPGALEMYRMVGEATRESEQAEYNKAMGEAKKKLSRKP